MSALSTSTQGTYQPCLRRADADGILASTRTTTNTLGNESKFTADETQRWSCSKSVRIIASEPTLLLFSPERSPRVEVREQHLHVPGPLFEDGHREEGVHEVLRVVKEVREGVPLDHLLGELLMKVSMFIFSFRCVALDMCVLVLAVAVRAHGGARTCS